MSITDISVRLINSHCFRYIMRGVKRERILRVLLNEPSGKLTKYRVAKESEASIGWTMEYLKNLEGMDLIEKTRVLDIRSLLDYWLDITKTPKKYDLFHPDIDIMLQEANLEYATTTYRGENLVNHYLFPSRVDIYIRKEELELWKKKLSKKGLIGKGNVRLLLGDEHVFYQKKRIDKMWVVSLPQLLLDLQREGGVCQEAYEMMVEKYVR